MRWTFLLALAGCGDNRAVPPDAPVPCALELTGNVIEHSIATCPILKPGTGDREGDSILSATLGAFGTTLGVQLDLGAAPIGDYSSASTLRWNALAIATEAGGGACVFSAGSDTVPSGSFTLHLTAVEPIHGTLAMTLFVLPQTTEQGMQTDCGPGTTENLLLAF